MSVGIFPALIVVLSILIVIVIGLMVNLIHRAKEETCSVSWPQCPHCGNTQLEVDASVVWSPHVGNWVLHRVFETGECNICHREFQQVK